MIPEGPLDSPKASPLDLTAELDDMESPETDTALFYSLAYGSNINPTTQTQIDKQYIRSSNINNLHYYKTIL